MCQRWKDSFAEFFLDMGVKPTPAHTIARVNKDGAYSCGKCAECQTKGWVLNCRWASKVDQNRSRRVSARSGRLDAAKAEEIRQQLSRGVPYKKVARSFGICVSLVGKIKRFEVWA
jgi:hypothetical protein